MASNASPSHPPIDAATPSSTPPTAQPPLPHRVRHLLHSLAPSAPGASPQPPRHAVSLTTLLAPALLLEATALALLAVAAHGGLAQSVSPLAQAWPWLLAPGALLFGAPLTQSSLPPTVGWPALALYAIVLLGACCLAARALHLARPIRSANRRHLSFILAATALLGLTFALLPALPSDDLYSYILYGRISVLHHANPLLVAPSAFPTDPFLRLVFWQGTLSVYGPVWLLLSAALTILAQALGGSLAIYVALFKLLGLLAHLANTALIWAILTRLAPRRRLMGALFYAWNPLCLLEFCASAHNDAIMLTFALLAILALAHLTPNAAHPLRWETLALICLGLSISTKYVWLALLPLYLAWVYARLRAQSPSPLPWRRLILAWLWRLTCIFAIVALTATPFWAGPRTLSSILYSPPAQRLDNSLLDALSWPLRAVAELAGASPHTAATWVDTALKTAGLIAFLILLTILTWRQRRAPTLAALLRSWLWALLGYICVASGWFWPWYVTWALALAALLPLETASLATFLLASGALTLYAFLPLYSAPIYGYRAILIFGPSLVYLLNRWWAYGWRSIASQLHLHAHQRTPSPLSG